MEPPVSLPRASGVMFAATAAAEIAIALRAEKLIYLTDVPGILEKGELVSEMTAGELRKKMEQGIIHGGMVA